MKHTILIVILLFTAINLLYSQPHKHPWWVVDRGGGKSTGDGLILHASIGQSAIQKMTADTFSLESGYLPGLRNLSGTSTTMMVNVSTGWNMVSVPLLVSNYKKIVLFPTAVSPAYAYQDGYRIKDILAKGVGYWLKYSSEQAVPITGTSIMLDTIDVNERWNMIGMVSYPVLTSAINAIPPLVIQSQYFGYDAGTGYFVEDTLKPGSAYWLKVNQAGKIVLKSGSVLIASSQSVISKAQNKPDDIKSLAEEKGLRSLILKDAEGRERILYFTAKSVEVDLERYELPPVPPSEIFDVRFKSQRNVEVAKKEKSDKQEFPIQISGAKYPLTIDWTTSVDDESEYTLELKSVSEDKIVSKKFLLGVNTNTLTIDEDLIGLKLMMTAKANVEIPKEYALYQNYPNPFNPTTKIKYDLPVDSRVIIRIYNILGQEVMKLVDEIQSAGYKIVELDGTSAVGGLSSGVYFYRIDAVSISDASKSFASVKKMLLIR